MKLTRQTKCRGGSLRLPAPVAVAVAIAIAIALGLLSGCSGTDLSKKDPAATHLNTLNLVDDSPALQFVLDSTAVSAAVYGSGSAFGPAPSGIHSVQLKAVRPARVAGDAGTTDLIALGTAVNENFGEANDYTVIGVGTVASPQTFTISAPGQRNEVAAAKFAWRIVNASPTSGAVDVYVTAPEAGIAAPQFVANLAFKAASTPQELTLVAQPNADPAAALYVNLVVELRASGTNTVLFNSGNLLFNERSRVLLAISRNTAGRGNALQLVAMGADGSGSLLRNANDPAAVRLAHLSYNSPALDLARVSPALTIAQNIAFRGVSARTSLASGTLDLSATQTASPSTVAFTSQVTAVRTQGYSVYATGPAASVDDVVLVDNQRSVPTQAQFRFLHAAGNLGSDSAVNIYLTLPGTAVDPNAATGLQASALAYRTATGYLAIPEGSYDVYFARTATATVASTVLLGPVNLQFVNGSIRTLALMDSGTSGLELLPVNDLSN